MKTENLSTLKIHKLTQAQYDRELEAGRIDESALYLTPDEDELAIDTTLSIEGQAADAKAVGDALANKQPAGDYALKNEIPDVGAFQTEDQVLNLIHENMPTSGVDLGITGATVGQIAKITAVDENGVPTAWEPAEMAGGADEWEIIFDFTATEAINNTKFFDISEDMNGNPFVLKKLLIVGCQKLGEEESGNAGSFGIGVYDPDGAHGEYTVSALASKASTAKKFVALIHSEPVIGTVLVSAMSSYNDTSMVGSLVYKNSYNDVRASRTAPCGISRITGAGNVGTFGIGSTLTFYGVRRK